MGIASKYNKGNKFDFTAGKDFEFFSLETLYSEDAEAEYTCLGLFFSEGRFGAAPVAITDTMYVNLPKHLNNDVKDIINDPEAIEQINAGKLAFKIYKYYNETYKKDCYSINWIDK